MEWQIALILLIVINSAGHILTKLSADKIPNGTAGFFYTSLFCAIIAFLAAVLLESPQINPTMVLLVIIGFVNTLGFYCQWQGSKFSLSKTVLFLPVGSIVSVGLSMIFLGEINLLTPKLIIGVIFCFAAAFLLSYNPSSEKNGNSIKWLIAVVLMTLSYGIAIFLLKIFSSAGQSTFLIGWFLGALLAAAAILATGEEESLRIEKRAVILTSLLAIAVVGAMFALFWTFKLGGPVSLVLPIQGFSVILIPMLVGWLMLGEIKHLRGKDWLGFLSGLAGVAFILL